MTAVQAIVSNIMFPKTSEELLWFIEENGRFNVEDVLYSDTVIWTVPRWCMVGDIVFFMHGKTVNASISALCRHLKEEQALFSPAVYEKLQTALTRGRELFKQYGGKIFAIGRITGAPQYVEDEDFSDGITQDRLHWKSRIYAEVGDIYCLEQPIDISEFNSFIRISRQSAVTPVFGEAFTQLKERLRHKNDLPWYIEESFSSAVPLTKVTHENWLSVCGQNRHRFFLESQFRSFYVDYFLMEFGDRKTIFRECPCIQNGNRYFADNVILFDGRFLPVEVKLNISAENGLVHQLAHYCHVEQLILEPKINRVAAPERMVQEACLVVDINGVYLYKHNTREIRQVCALDKIRSVSDILALRSRLKIFL